MGKTSNNDNILAHGEQNEFRSIYEKDDFQAWDNFEKNEF